MNPSREDTLAIQRSQTAMAICRNPYLSRTRELLGRIQRRRIRIPERNPHLRVPRRHCISKRPCLLRARRTTKLGTERLATGHIINLAVYKKAGPRPPESLDEYTIFFVVPLRLCPYLVRFLLPFKFPCLTSLFSPDALA